MGVGLNVCTYSLRLILPASASESSWALTMGRGMRRCVYVCHGKQERHQSAAAHIHRWIS